MWSGSRHWSWSLPTALMQQAAAPFTAACASPDLRAFFLVRHSMFLADHLRVPEYSVRPLMNTACHSSAPPLSLTCSRAHHLLQVPLLPVITLVHNTQLCQLSSVHCTGGPGLQGRWAYSCVQESSQDVIDGFRDGSSALPRKLFDTL
jgi:hypothetical protein